MTDQIDDQIAFEDLQALPEPLAIETWDEDPEFVGNASNEEISVLLQEGGMLCRVYVAQEYCIFWKNGQFIFEVWHAADTCAYTHEYASLSALLQAEVAEFDLSLFEIC